jgi:hypothetical protein
MLGMSETWKRQTQRDRERRKHAIDDSSECQGIGSMGGVCELANQNEAKQVLVKQESEKDKAKPTVSKRELVVDR